MRKKVLLVDDEAAFGRMVKINLEDTGEYAVTHLTQGKLACETAKQMKPDIIFLDIVMPEMTGEDVFNQLKEEKEMQNIPVVFLTAMATKEDVDSGKGMIGGHPFLAKPVTVDQIIECIKNYTAK